jgi:fibronectin type 3 domain-containing protein
MRSNAFTTRKEVPANTTSTTIYLSSAAVQDLRVVARNTAGGNSAASNVVTIATTPEAPLSVGAQAAHDSPTTAIDVFWDSIDSCQFHVERFNTQTHAWDRIASDVVSLSYRDAGLEPGTSYSYRVIAVAANSAGDSTPSDVATATTAPRAVTGLAVSGVTANSVSLSWNDVVGEGSYRVERSQDGINWTTVTLLYSDTTRYTATGLQSNTTYYFRVTGMADGSQFAGESAEPVIARTR